MDIQTVLAPVDGTEAAMESLEYAVAVADRYGATVHALHVFGEQTTEELAADDSDHADVVAESERMTEDVQELAGEIPVTHSVAYGFSQRRLLQHPGSVILDAAEDIAADFIVVPREPVTGDPSAVIEKAAEYVLAYASEPVLSV
jgi:nucleotide-binding universal stress UspA family protein